MSERRASSAGGGMLVIERVEESLRAALPDEGLRIAYRAGHLALRPYWRLARPTVVGSKVVVCCDEHVLLLRHSYARRTVWDLPGGFVHPRERAVSAICRELEEEIGITELTDLRCIGREPARTDGKRETLLTFCCEVASREVRPNPAEIDEARWYPAERLPRTATPFVRRMVARSRWPRELLDGIEAR